MPEFADKILEEVENQHYKFQIGCYFSNSKKIRGALLLWNEKIEDSYWNFATKIIVVKKSLRELVKKVISFYKTRNRQPVIYFTPFTRPKNLPNLIKKFGFKSEFRDAWMFYEKTRPKEVVMPRNFVIKQVRNKEGMRVFVDVFNQAYSGATPEEPYGELPKEYGECLFDSFTKQKDKKTIHYLGFLNKKPVGIVTLIYSGNFGCIYNLGVAPNYRRKGISSTLVLNAVVDSIKNKTNIVFLQTEQGSYNEKYFNKLGFSTEFIGEGFVL